MGIRERAMVSAGLAASILCASISGAAAAAMARAEATLAPWPEASRLLARKLISSYGAPDEAMPHYLSWNGRAPFNAITVYANRVSSNQDGILLQSVGYRVPVGKWRALNAFGHGVSYDVILNELVACSDGEETNLLALNLADEVIQGRLGPGEARALFDRTLARSYAGKGSRYLDGLTFDPGERKKQSR